ncbi:tyrosine-type recombinase/integrase [Paenibacillus odorifer]|uniref:tyrosine-type recombinase/integrase n=1 Tax=Paenibacillus odorifer TaxID=189426 RepID=UPI00096E9D5C|nr:tyrosine-type recombinase/integrase [Paenibacillus odorifer]OMD71200.1 hypothetical protein BSK50_26320 [Paenibacillus odorifer]
MEAVVHNKSSNNVVGFQNSSVGESIETFLMNMGRKSIRTKYNYEQALKRFFMWHCGKTFSELKVEDLDIINEKMIRYQLHLINDYNPKYSNSTVNTLTAPVMSLYEFLSRNRNYNVRAEDVIVDMQPEDSENYGELTVREAEKMAELSFKQKKGQEKSALIRLAYTTSFRRSSLLALEWSDIKFDQRNQCYLVNGIGKGKKKHTRPISIDLYNELLKIKEQKYYARYNDNKIFHLSEDGIGSMMKVVKDEMGITPERNVVFHSLRNVAAGYIADAGGSIEEIRDQLNHSGYGALKHYIHKDKDYANMAGMKMDENVDTDLFEELSKEELLKLIFSQSEGVILNMQRQIAIIKKESVKKLSNINELKENRSKDGLTSE